MKKLSLVILLAASLIACGKSSRKYQSVKRKCVIVAVEGFSPGEMHTMQSDYIWKAKTECDMTFTFYKEVSVGDTVCVEYRTYEN